MSGETTEQQGERLSLLYLTRCQPRQNLSDTGMHCSTRHRS